MRQKSFTLSREELSKLYAFYSCEKIGAQFGVCAEVVRRRLHECGIAAMKRGGRRSFDPPREALYELYQSKSMAEIAKHFGVGETVVFKRLKEHGIELKEHINHRLKPGKVFSAEHRAKLSEAHKGRVGEKNHNWKGGKTLENLRARSGWQAKEWRQKSLIRAGGQCEQCGVKNGSMCECCGVKISLHVHHIKSFAKFVDDRFDPANSEVLCPKCHHTKHQMKIG
jgi:transposase